MDSSRRALLTAAAGMTALGIGPRVMGQSPDGAVPTPEQEIGPFSPVTAPFESRADLTRIAGQSSRAIGPVIEIEGRVLTVTGEPVRSAMVLVWHADAAGRYRHPRDRQAVGVDPGFGGHALMRTGPDGGFQLRSVMPGAYEDAPGSRRTPHIHYEIIGEESRLITQMYFPGEPLNETDRLLGKLDREGAAARALIARRSATRAEAGARAFAWDIVLTRA